jgi:hypothetical protein
MVSPLDDIHNYSESAFNWTAEIPAGMQLFRIQKLDNLSQQEIEDFIQFPVFISFS